MSKETTTNIDPISTSKEDVLAQISTAVYEGRPLLGEGGVLTGLIKQALESTLKGDRLSSLRISLRRRP